jgi:hypothetical protein
MEIDMYRTLIPFLAAGAIAAIGAQPFAHAKETNPLHPKYYAERIDIAPKSGAFADIGEARNPLHPRYAHVRYTGDPASADPNVTMALLYAHNPLHPMYVR